jgi:hypothetical protein
MELPPLFLYGKSNLTVSEDDGAAAIRYGLGFGQVTTGILQVIEIQELAVVECLRYFIPFADVVKTFARQIADYPKAQMVGYLVEYMVSFALVANFSTADALDALRVSQRSVESYLTAGDSSEIFFPDHMCGPDVMYKCAKNETLYIAQCKFINSVTKQKLANACETTEPTKFYYKRNGSGVLKGFDGRREILDNAVKELQRTNYSLQQILFIHTGGEKDIVADGVLVINRKSSPDFFNKIGNSNEVWDFLDSIRLRFQV